MKLVTIRPNYDVTTKYISTWAEEIISLAKTKGLDVVDLNKDKANKKDFEGRMKKLQVKLIFINGHGSADCIFGQNNETLIKVGDNDNLLSGKITYALSCKSAKRLGLQVSQYKNSTYIGYRDEFVFLADSRYSGKPLDDPKAKPFMESSNQVMLSLLKGNTAGKSSENSKNKFREHLIRLSSSVSDPDSIQAMQFLRWNMIHQVCLGDKDASIKMIIQEKR
jgi:hypothetical protein